MKITIMDHTSMTRP